MYSTLDLLNYVKELKKHNLDILSSGNISLRLDANHIAIKPTGLNYDDLTLEDISVVDLQGNLILGLKASSDLDIHLKIFSERKDINCIIHTHSHYATVMSCLNLSLKVLTTLHADYFGKEILCMRYINHRKSNLGVKFIELHTNVCLLERHGTLIVDADPKKAIKSAVVIEEISKLNFHIMQLQRKISPMLEEDICSLNEYYATTYGNK